MAEDKKPKKDRSLVKSIKPVKKISMRDNASKSRAAAAKPKKVRRAASAASKPVGKIGRALTTELHVITPKKETFFTRSRSLTPRYVKNSYTELRQVSWPNWGQTWRLSFAVFIFAIALGTFISAVDFGLERLLKEIIF